MAELSGNTLQEHIVYASHVDKRDHFIVDTLLTKYVIVCDPVQTHLSPMDQQVITVPAGLILAEEGIGRAYKRAPQVYDLGHGVKAYIFEKYRPFTFAEASSLFERFFSSYPEWRGEYEGKLDRLPLAVSPASVAAQ